MHFLLPATIKTQANSSSRVVRISVDKITIFDFNPEIADRSVDEDLDELYFSCSEADNEEENFDFDGYDSEAGMSRDDGFNFNFQDLFQRTCFKSLKDCRTCAENVSSVVNMPTSVSSTHFALWLFCTFYSFFKNRFSH